LCREEFLELYPADKIWGSEEMLNDPLVARRCGSTDILDAKKMRTLFMDYPDSGRRYKIRFNVAGCDPKSVRVSTDGDRIVVRATKYASSEDSASCGDLTAVTGREYCRKIQKPKDVDHTKFKAYLTADSVLVVEAPVPPSLNLRKVSDVDVVATLETVLYHPLMLF
jgi:HSP20 family molecular chaperone IbpA